MIYVTLDIQYIIYYFTYIILIFLILHDNLCIFIEYILNNEFDT